MNIHIYIRLLTVIKYSNLILKNDVFYRNFIVILPLCVAEVKGVTV